MSNITALQQQTDSPRPQDFSTQAIMFDFSMIEKMNELAQMMSTSKVAVPAHLRGSSGDCLAVVMQAAQWGMNPFAVAQKTFTVNGSGVLGYEAQLVNAVITARAPVTGRMQYEWFGEWGRVVGNTKEFTSKNGGTFRKLASTPEDEAGCGVRVWATFRGESEPRELELLLTQVLTRNSTLWAEDPKQQLAYLAVKRWARLYCPDVILGVYTPDELEEHPPAERDMGVAEDVTPPKSRAERAKAAIADRRQAATTVPPVVVPAVADVLAAISAAATPDALAATAELAAQLPEADRAAARKAYKDRAEAIAREAVQADPETGEIREPADAQQQGDGAPSFADAHAAVRSGDLDLARDIARHLPEAQQQQIEAAIANLSGNQQQDATARGRSRQRGQGGLGLD